MVLHIYSLRTPSFPVALFFFSVFIAWRISSSENSLSRSGSLRVLLLIDISGLSLFLFRVLKWSYKLVMSGNVLFLFCLLKFSIFQYCFGFVDFRFLIFCSNDFWKSVLAFCIVILYVLLFFLSRSLFVVVLFFLKIFLLFKYWARLFLQSLLNHRFLLLL